MDKKICECCYQWFEKDDEFKVHKLCRDCESYTDKMQTENKKLKEYKQELIEALYDALSRISALGCEPNVECYDCRWCDRKVEIKKLLKEMEGDK